MSLIKSIKLTKMKRIIVQTAVVMLFGIFMTACLENETELEKQMKQDDKRVLAYLNDNNIEADRHSAGMYYESINTNASGTAVLEESVVSFFYHISTMQNGGYTEMTLDSLNPQLYYHEYNYSLPNAMFYGMDMMRSGEKYRFYIPSYLAYNSFGDPEFFPSHTNFVLEIEILDIQSLDERNALELTQIEQKMQQNEWTGAETTDSGLRFLLTEQGSGDEVQANSTFKMHYARKYLDGTLIEATESDSPVTIRMGYDNLVPGLEEGVLKMQEGDKAILVMASELAFGTGVQVLPAALREPLIDEGWLYPWHVIEPFSPVIYEVEIVEVL